MYDELVKRLREAPSDWYDADLHYEAADAIEELSKPKWIPVTDKLPESGGSYIVYLRPFKGKTDLGYAIGDLSYPTEMYFDKGQMLWVCENESYNAILSAVDTENEYHVTHWMQLPQPPEGEQA